MSAVNSNPESGSSKKIQYINNIKILLTVLVVLHHTVIAYGAAGGWYYTEKSIFMAALIPMTMFVSINQSFFMGFFFLLAAYFIDSSCQRKSPSRFISDRLIRLGIPLLFYSFVLSPFISYLVYYFAKGRHITFLQYLSGYDSWIDFGVMWFVAALLLFTGIYMVIKTFLKIKLSKKLPAPGTSTILLTAVTLGIISFLVRIPFPVGWVLKPVGFQLGHFPQYIALFSIGLLAASNNWFQALSEQTSKQLTRSAWLCLLFFPVFFIIRIKTDMPVSWYSGGYHWQSLLYAVWEQWIGLSILTVMLIKGKKYWNCSSLFLSKISRSAFAVYIFHPLVIVCLSLAARNWAADPAIKFLIVAPAAVLASFVLSLLIVRIPGINKII